MCSCVVDDVCLNAYGAKQIIQVGETSSSTVQYLHGIQITQVGNKQIWDAYTMCKISHTRDARLLGFVLTLDADSWLFPLVKAGMLASVPFLCNDMFIVKPSICKDQVMGRFSKSPIVSRVIYLLLTWKSIPFDTRELCPCGLSWDRADKKCYMCENPNTKCWSHMVEFAVNTKFPLYIAYNISGQNFRLSNF